MSIENIRNNYYTVIQNLKVSEKIINNNVSTYLFLLYML